MSRKHTLCSALVLATFGWLGNSAMAQQANRLISERSPIQQPYAYVTGGALSGASVAASPDPLISYVWDNPKAEDHLQEFIAHPISAEAVEGESNVIGLETVSAEKCDILISGQCYIRMDMGTELPAWIEVDSPDWNGDIHLGISEFNCPELLTKFTTPVKHGNTYRLELNKEYYEGVRYAFIRVRNFSKPFHITAVRAIAQVKPTNYTGSFHSDNPMLDRIWYTGAWVTKANMREDCFGAILMNRGDRYSWTGDAYPAQAASMTAFSNYDAVYKNLLWTESHPNNIETYEMYWIESLIDYLMHSGDEEGFRALMPKAEARLTHAVDIFANPSSLRFVGWDDRTGRGFDHPDAEENKLSQKMVSLGAMKHYAATMRLIGETAKASLWERKADALAKSFSRVAANLRKLGMHSSADAINAHLVADLQSLYHPDLADRLQRLSFSPFNQYMLLQAMAETGHYDHAFASVFDMWGGQINYGATCFFEVYRPTWNDLVGQNGPIPYTQAGVTSLAHPWGAGIVAWLSREMLGIKPTTPGFKTFSVKPHFEGVARQVSGQVNTPHGPIHASFNLNTGRDTLVVPTGCTADLYIPLEGMQAKSLRLDGTAVEMFTMDDTHILLAGLSEGTHTVQVDYEGQPREFQQEEYKYAITDVTIDRDTHGEWFKKYGRDGYLIVGGNEDKSDLVKLPSYVSKISFDTSIDPVSVHRTTSIKAIDPAAMLPVSDEPGARKAFGCYYSNGLHLTPAEITVRGGSKPYRCSAYFADCDKGGRDFIVDILDLETGNMLAPSQRITDFAGGVYISFTTDRSVRIIASFVHGDNSIYNALFFDAAETTPDGITMARPETDRNLTYNLMGTKMPEGTLPPGIYIQDGRKMFVK